MTLPATLALSGDTSRKGILCTFAENRRNVLNNLVGRRQRILSWRKAAHSLLISADYKRLDRTDFALAYVAFRFLRCPLVRSLRCVLLGTGSLGGRFLGSTSAQPTSCAGVRNLPSCSIGIGVNTVQQNYDQAIRTPVDAKEKFGPSEVIRPPATVCSGTSETGLDDSLIGHERFPVCDAKAVVQS
jgi:hypothetical protein